jgi:hypothetical protein
MSNPDADGLPLVVCALEFERRALLRHPLTEIPEIQCCGPGTAGVSQWSQQRGSENRLVILCGLAAGLDPAIASGEARIVTEVIDARTGRRWAPNAFEEMDHQGSIPLTVLAASEKILCDATAKRDLHAKTGAHLADLESAAFADAATARGWRWAIVRGVSDAAADSLPFEAARFIDARGRTQPLEVAKCLTFRPSLLMDLLRLRPHSTAAMSAVSQLVQNMINHETRRRAGAN